MKRLLLISGAVGAGKSSVASELKDQHFFRGISSGVFLRELLAFQGRPDDRAELQNLGDKLDEETDYFWIVSSVALPTIESCPNEDNWFIDAVRKRRQVEHFRDRFGNFVKHVHLIASEPDLKSRYLSRKNNYSERDYIQAIEHSNEVSARSLGSIADWIFDSSQNTATDIAEKLIELWQG